MFVQTSRRQLQSAKPWRSRHRPPPRRALASVRLPLTQLINRSLRPDAVARAASPTRTPMTMSSWRHRPSGRLQNRVAAARRRRRWWFVRTRTRTCSTKDARATSLSSTTRIPASTASTIRSSRARRRTFARIAIATSVMSPQAPPVLGAALQGDAYGRDVASEAEGVEGEWRQAGE